MIDFSFETNNKVNDDVFDFDTSSSTPSGNTDVGGSGSVSVVSEQPKKKRGRPKKSETVASTVETGEVSSQKKISTDDMMKNLNFIYENFAKMTSEDIVKKLNISKAQLTKAVNKIKKNLEQTVLDGKITQDEYDKIVTERLTPPKKSLARDDMDAFDAIIQKAVQDIRGLK